MHIFKHPKYYKELRKRNKSDQVISLRTHDGECERAPGQGLKQQATSLKPGGTSLKRQATSSKLPDPRSTEHGYWRSFRG